MQRDKFLIIICMIIFLVGSVIATDFATITENGVNFEDSVDTDFVSEFLCAIDPLACSDGKLAGDVSPDALQKVRTSGQRSDVADSLYYNNKVRGFLSNGAQITEDIKIDEKGEVSEGGLSFGHQSESFGEFIGKKIDPDFIQGRQIDISKSVDSSGETRTTAISFVGDQNYLDINGNKFENIDKDSNSFLEISEDGQIISGDLTVTQDSQFTLGGDTLDVPAKTQVIFKNGNVHFIGSQNSEIKIRDVKEGFQDKVILGKDGMISLLNGDTLEGINFVMGGAEVEGGVMKVEGVGAIKLKKFGPVIVEGTEVSFFNDPNTRVKATSEGGVWAATPNSFKTYQLDPEKPDDYIIYAQAEEGHTQINANGNLKITNGPRELRFETGENNRQQISSEGQVLSKRSTQRVYLEEGIYTSQKGAFSPLQVFSNRISSAGKEVTGAYSFNDQGEVRFWADIDKPKIYKQHFNVRIRAPEGLDGPLLEGYKSFKRKADAETGSWAHPYDEKKYREGAALAAYAREDDVGANREYLAIAELFKERGEKIEGLIESSERAAPLATKLWGTPVSEQFRRGMNAYTEAAKNYKLAGMTSQSELAAQAASNLALSLSRKTENLQEKRDFLTKAIDSLEYVSMDATYMYQLRSDVANSMARKKFSDPMSVQQPYWDMAIDDAIKAGDTERAIALLNNLSKKHNQEGNTLQKQIAAHRVLELTPTGEDYLIALQDLLPNVFR